MINVSETYQNQIKQNGRRFSARGKISFSDGRTADLTGDSFMQGGVQFSDCTSASNEFDVGTAAAGKATITLKNYDGRWNGYDFTGAVITLATGLLLPDGTTEWLEKGIFTVYNPVTLGGVVVEVTAKDNMQKFDRKYDSTLTYPATLAEILRDACTRCGVTLSTQEFLNDDYSVAARPSDDATTYRDIVSYVAQLAGSWARINNLGELILGWYDTDRFYPESGNTVDGNDELTASGNPAVFDAYPNTAIRKLNVTGNTTQTVTHQGKNLIHLEDGTYSANGITATVNNGEITINGSPTVKFQLQIPFVSNLQLPINTDYTHTVYYNISNNLSCAPTIARSNGVRQHQFVIDYLNYSVTQKSVTGQFSEYMTINHYDIYFAKAGEAYDNVHVKVQFEQGSTSTAYEQFMPESPSPDYPAPITGVEYIEKWEGMSAENRNLCAPNYFKSQEWYGYIMSDGTIYPNDTLDLHSDYIHINPEYGEMQFTIFEFATHGNPIVGFYQSDKTYISRTSLPSTGTTPLVTPISIPSNAAYIRFCIANPTYYGGKYKVEFGTVATDYSVAPEDLPSYQKIVFPRPQYSLPDGTADSYEVIGATGTEKIKKVILDGSKIGTQDYWIYSGSENDTSICYGAPAGILSGRLAGIENSCCDKFQYAGEDSNYQHGDTIESYWPHKSQSDYLLIRINKSRLSGWSDSWTNSEKVAAFKSWLAANPVTVLYELATPVAITGTPQSVTASADTTVTADNGGQAEVTYSGPDVLGGGNFSNYSQPDTVVGGVFRKNLMPAAEIDFLKSCTISTDDVHITGVQIIPSDDKKPTLKVGSDGYVVSIEKNPLAQDNLDGALDNLGKCLIDFRFRPMRVSALDDPSIEAGDVAWVTAPKGRRYATIISSLTWNINSYETFAADAETPAQRQQTHFSAAAKAVQAAKDNTVKQISAYDAAVGIFSSMAALAMGLYFTRQKLDDGSYILYWHDKPKLADSQTIWKLTQNVLVVSDDGGSTWRGMDKDGNILAKVLTVIGVNASWIVAGLLKSHNGSSWINMEDGSFSLGNGALVYNPTDGFKCIESQKICMPGYPDFYATIGKGPGAEDRCGFFIVDKVNNGDYPFFKIWSTVGATYLSGVNTKFHFVDTNDNSHSAGYMDEEGWHGGVYASNGISSFDLYIPTNDRYLGLILHFRGGMLTGWQESN